MNSKELKGDWQEQKSKLKQKFATLINSDLLLAATNKEEILGRMQLKMGKTKEELLQIIGDL